MPAKVSLQKSGLSALSKSDRRRIGRESVAIIGRAVHRVRKPNKFKRSAASRYGHVPRGRRYNLAKLARYDHPTAGKATGEVLDFVWSGQSRAQVMASDKIKPAAPSADVARVDVIFNAPKFNYAKLEDGRSVASEFLRANARETAYLMRLGHEARTRRLRIATRTTTQRIG